MVGIGSLIIKKRNTIRHICLGSGEEKVYKTSIHTLKIK